MSKNLNISEVLINWYAINKRILPWRNTVNPYYIWLSEIILQQTQVKQGLPYYNSFIKAPVLRVHFPAEIAEHLLAPEHFSKRVLPPPT